ADVFGGVNLEGLELGDGFLEGTDFSHHAHYFVCLLTLDVKLTGGGEERTCLHRKLELGGPEHEELPPGLLQQQDLVSERQSRERGHRLGPLDRHEQQARSRLADRLGVVGVAQEQLVRVL
ncbi:hypothetical protein EGW08_021417, partial [Elysia chlorotica]